MTDPTRPNLVERLEEAVAMIDDLRTVTGDIVIDPVAYGRIEAEISNVEGVVGEVLTMIDGR